MNDEEYIKEHEQVIELRAELKRRLQVLMVEDEKRNDLYTLYYYKYGIPNKRSFLTLKEALKFSELDLYPEYIQHKNEYWSILGTPTTFPYVFGKVKYV